MNKRMIQKEEKRSKIIETARNCYANQGFLVSTATIAQEANVSHGSIFSHFSTSEELISAVLEDFYIIITAKLRGISSTEGISSFLTQHLEVLEEHELFYKRLIEEKTLLPEDSQLLFVEMQSTVSHNFSKVIDNEKQTIKDLPLHSLFNTWIGIIHYYLQNSSQFSPNASVLKRYKRELIFLYTELIKK